MDISKINTKNPAEQGAFLHLRHPVLEHLMYVEGKGVDENGKWDGNGEEPKPVGVTVKGSEAPSLKKYLLASRKRSVKSRDFDQEEEGLKFMCKAVISFHGLTKDGADLDASSVDDVRMFFEQSANLIEQVTAFSSEALNFFGNAKSD